MEAKISHLSESVSSLSKANEENKQSLEAVLLKLDTLLKCEDKKKTVEFEQTNSEGAEEDPEVSLNPRSKKSALYPGTDEPFWPLLSATPHEDGGLDAIQTADVQSEFRILQDVYSRVRVHSKLKFSGSRTGVKSEFKEAVNIICNSAKYADLGLKVMTYIQRKVERDPNYQVNDQLQEVYCCWFALLRYLQEEYSTLMSGSDFGPRTKHFYKSFLKDTSAYPASHLNKLELACCCASMQEERPPRRGGYTGWSGGPRGGFRNARFRGRGRGQYNTGQFPEGGRAVTPRPISYDWQAPQEL